MIPKNAKIVANKHLAEGEVTGHFHQATSDSAKVYEHEGTMMLDAPEGTEVVHQEHGTITIPSGEYDRLIVREYDPFADEIREVRD